MAWQDFLRNNSSMLTQTGLGLLGGKNAQEQVSMGAQGLMQAQQQTKTMKFLEMQNPELAQAVKSGGLSAQDAVGMLWKQKLEAPKPKTYDFKTLPDGTYGTFDSEAGQFNPMGKAAKEENPDEFTLRQQQAQQLGMKPDDPRYQTFALTGKMPREDAQPLTATDKKAILEADEMVLATESAIPLIDQAIDLNKKAYDGFSAGIRGKIAGNLGYEGGEATMELDNVVATQALGQLKAIFGAAPTEGERKILLELQGSVNQPANVRGPIFERAKKLAQRRLEFYQQRANEMRGGEYYKPSGAANQGNRTSSGLNWSVEP